MASDTRSPTDSTEPTEPRRRRPALVAGAAVATVAAAVGLWLTQPWLLLVDSEVDEAFPGVDSGADPAADAAAAPADVAAEDEPAASPDGAEPDAGAGTEVGADPTDRGEVDAPAAGGEADGAAVPDAPVALLTGTFASRDHQTSGSATVYRLPDGSLTLRLEDLATDNGPDLFVYLDDDSGDAPAGDYDDGTDLGRLKGNLGNQNYDVPPDTDLEVLRTVVIWCDRFASPFGTVELTPVA